MSAMLKSKAVTAVNKGQPSSFYSEDKANPVIQALDQEIKTYTVFMKKRNSPGYKPAVDEASSRGSDALFELWNKYEPRLPKLFYQSKLLEMGDFLVSVKEYNLALWQCFTRYLKSFGDVNVEEINDVQTFKETFFPMGFETEDAGFTFRALMGKSICSYQVIKMTDPKLQNVESVERSITILMFLRLVTQVILPKESLCWLVYNGTIHIYSISRHLMTLGHSGKVLEFLLWASMCMEASVPLLAVKYLPWRSTLYTAVCQCYYDCKAGQHAEGFARRALSKINELSQLESMSNSSEKKSTESSFRQATIKMATMVYKRAVFETRRKPKGLLRPKTRANLKDAAQLPWPRTNSERLLAEMFEGSSAQMLCILETLTDSNRRTLISSPAAADNEVEILDVYAELFMAAQEIIAGGGGSQGSGPAQDANILIPGMGGVRKEKPLLHMAMQEEDGVPLSVVGKIIKLSYCYEQWETLDSMQLNTLAAIKEVNDPQYGPLEKELEILAAYDKCVPRAKQRKLFQNNVDEEEDGLGALDAPSTLPPPPKKEEKEKEKETDKEKEKDRVKDKDGEKEKDKESKPTSWGEKTGRDDLIDLAEVLLSVVNGPYTQQDIDIDMVVDACLLLWGRCKAVFQKFQTGSTDNPKYLQKMENPSKWVYVLDIVHQVLSWCGLSAVDPALTAEVVLRLALVFEASAALETSKEIKKQSAKTTTTKSKELEENSIISSIKEQETSRRGSAGRDSAVSSDTSHVASQAGPVSLSRQSVFSATLLSQSVREQLLQARDILETGLQNVSYARQVVAITDGKSIADVSWVKELNQELFEPENLERTKKAVEGTLSEEEEQPGDIEDTEVEEQKDATAVWNMIKDLHLELLFMYHRVCLKLSEMGVDPNVRKNNKPFKRKTCSNIPKGSSERIHAGYIENYEELESMCRKNNISKSMLFMQKALLSGNQGNPTKGQKKLLEDALGIIKKAESDERRLYMDNVLLGPNTSQAVKRSKLPPSPILLSRTDTMMTFKPDSFIPINGEKVAWYRIFARNASGSNVKVRLNDYSFPGTGEEVPAFRCELKVSGLTPGEKYVFAIAAYTPEGQLIGDCVGETTKPILASHPLPLLMTWAYLSQVAYQVGCYDIAKEACQVLWDHFVAKPPPPESITYTTSAKQDFTLTLHKLNFKVVSIASPVLLRMYLAGIFISVDISVREGQLYCNTLCDKGPLSSGQINRLHQCEKMLVGVELAGWLNEANLALQAIVQCYGLLSPLIHFKIPAVPIIQVLERCNAVLQEIPIHLRQKRLPTIAESIHHMTACMTYHMAKVLRTWGQRSLAGNFNDTGRKLLALDPEKEGKFIPAEGEEIEPPTETGSLTLAALKKKKAKKVVVQPKEEIELLGNEQLKALEAHMLRLSKQAQGEHELTGNEDPSILHAYIAYLPSRLAYKEVVKFRRRARYLEFFVQCAQKALSEGISDLALEWCEETVMWLAKRNEGIIGSTKASVGKQPGATTIIGDDPKKFAAALVEYSKDKDQSPRTKDAQPKKAKTTQKQKRIKYKAIGIAPHMTDVQKRAQEEVELKAIEILQLYFVDMYHNSNKHKKMRKVSTEEMPWRSQLNIVEGLSQFGVFLAKLEIREKLIGGAANYLYRTSFLDQEWFPFETAGTLVVGWSGGPSRLQTRQETRQSGRDSSPLKIEPKQSGIEMAAAAATGKIPPPMYPIPPEEEEDTPRTYRSELPTGREQRGKKTSRPFKERSEEEQESVLMTKEEAIGILRKTMDYLKRAVVLAHRGQHWTLLQNACRAMWNCAHTALMRAHSPDKDGQSFLEVDTLHSIMWQPFCTAADCLLDMLVELQFETDQRQKAKKKQLMKEEKPLVNSWMGNIKDERGGASLKFESPLDDISSVDTRWLKRIVLRVLELLYYEQKWERLVDIALRFNAISDDRYVEDVNPLLVQAQRKLIGRIAQYDGQLPPQPHFQQAMKEKGGGPITAKDYTTIHLKVQIKTDNMSEINPGAHIDPEGHDAYSAYPTGAYAYYMNDQLNEEVYEGGLHALRLCCVPVDVNFTLQSLRKVLNKSQYTSRALQHSRRLLILFLAGQMSVSGENQVTSQGPSRVDFVPNTARPQPTMPVDLSKEEFLSVDDVQTSPLPRGQIGVVMSSYDKTIELLLAANQKGLAAEAMRELGNLHYYSGNIRGAYKWWSESLDLLLGTPDSIHGWRSLSGNTEDFSRTLLDRCGLWGCLVGGIICSNIAQYILTSDLGLRTECCFLSGFFFKALFRSSLPHPTADHDYALYEVGEGCEVTNLVPGVDLLSERFRCDGRTLVSALRFVMDELARGRHNLFVLPLLTLHQFFTTFVCRDLQRSVDGRILKVRILTDLALFEDAIITLQRLLNGERLPHSADSNFRQVESKPSSAKFVTSKPMTDPLNLKALEAVIDKRLSSGLGTLYGPHLTCHLSLVQSHLFSALADTMPVLPKFEDVGPPGASVYVQPQTIATMSKGQDKKGFKPPIPAPTPKPGKGAKDGKPERKTSRDRKGSKQDMAQNEDGGGADAEGDDGSGSGRLLKRFSESRKTVTLEMVKGELLASSDKIVSTVSEIIMDNAAQSEKGIESMNAAELELVVLCKLELASVARQRHHSAMGARIVHSALKLLQNSDLFKDRKDFRHLRRSASRRSQQPRDVSPIRLVEPGESSQYEYQNFQSRSRLDARLWLTSRLSLVKTMVGEIKGMGMVKGTEKTVKTELADVRTYCAEGVAEAEACGDIEMQAEFLLQGVLLNMMEGVALEETYSILHDVSTMLDTVTQRSAPGELLRAIVAIHMIDMEALAPKLGPESSEKRGVVDVTKEKYLQAQTWLMDQLELMGEVIEHRYDSQEEFTTPVSPLQNLYLPHLLPLVQLKLRIGHAMSRKAVRNIKAGSVDPVEAWSHALGVLNTALEMCTVIAMRIANVEAELLLNIGKIQRQLFHLGRYQANAVAKTLTDAIKTSYAHDHDLSLIRQAYLEIAVLYLANSGLITLKNGSILEPVLDSEDENIITKDASKKKPKKTEQGQPVIHNRRSSSLRTIQKQKLTKEQQDDDQSPNPGSPLAQPHPPTSLAPTNLKSGRLSRSTKSTNAPQRPETPTSPKPKRQASKDNLKPQKKPSHEEEKKAAWIAARCAAAVGQAQRARMLLTGDTSITSQPIGPDAQKELPDYVVLDLVASYVLGERKRVYKNEIEEELAPLTEALEPPPLNSYDDQVNMAREATKDLSWIHILGYQGILQRLCSTSTLSVQNAELEDGNSKAGELGSEFDLGFISHAQFDISQNHDCVRAVLFNIPWSMRLNYLHQFLANHLPVYVTDCTAIYPPSELQLKSADNIPATDIELITKSYEGNKTVPIDIAPDGTKLEVPSAPGTQENLLKPSDKNVVSVTDNDLGFQWYQPSLDEYNKTRQTGDQAGKEDKQVMVIYALSKKPDRYQTAMTWVSLAQLIDLHDRLAVLVQRGEISLADEKKGKKEPSNVSEKTTKAKKGTRIKALSPKIKRDETLEVLLRQCMGDAQKLFGFNPEAETDVEGADKEDTPATSAANTGADESQEAKIPFDVSKPNMHNFEKLFDPSFGSTLKEAKMLAWFMQLFT